MPNPHIIFMDPNFVEVEVDLLLHQGCSLTRDILKIFKFCDEDLKSI